MQSVPKKLFLLIALIWSVAGLAVDYKQMKVDMESQIEGRVLKVLKGYDELAIVFASVNFGKTERRLPGTPFVIKDNELNKDFQMKVSGVEVTIYTKMSPVPTELRGLVQDAVDDLGVEPNITIKGLPSTYGDNVLSVNKLISKDANNENAVPKINLNLDELKTALAAQAEKLQLIVMALGGVAVVIMVMAILGIFSLGRNRKIIERGLKNISASVEESGGGGGPVIDVPQQQLQQARNQQQGLPSGDGEAFKNFSNESIVAMLSDCYWGQYDTFAAYIWKRIPVAKRKDILEASSFLEEYVHFLSGMDEQNLGFEQDPYYLDPLPIHHLNNEELTAAVRENPGLIEKIPNMRVDSLSLEVKERLQFLSKQGRFGEFKMPDFGKKKASPARILKKHIKFVIHSIQEEEEILALEGLDPFVCRDIPTLGFLANADEGKVKELLEGFSAQELAQAWIGPESVLQKLASLLPEKKFKLVEAYLERMRPSRQSRPFQVLHFRANDLCFPENSLNAVAEETAA